jgi:hypothetical protein
MERRCMVRPRIASRRLAALSVALLAAGGTAAVTTSASAAGLGSSWHIASVFSTASGVSDIESVEAVSAGNAWLAGETFPAAAGQAPVIVEHWSQGAWHDVSVPASVDPHNLTMAGNVIAASSPTNAWLFSGYQGAAGPHAVALGWNGLTWSTHAFSLWSNINAAAVFSRHSAWAFGSRDNGLKPLAARFDGHTWQKVRAPLIPQGASALSPRDIWIVGPKTGSLASGRPVFAAARWDGSAWHEVTLPTLSLPKGDSLAETDILALTRTNVWVSGFLSAGEGVAPGYVLLHLTAHGWRRVHVPFPAGSLTALTRDGAGGLWLTAQADTSAAQFFLHDVGGHWTRQRAPGVAGHTTQLSAISWARSAPFGWAGGEVIKGGNSRGALLKSAP